MLRELLGRVLRGVPSPIVTPGVAGQSSLEDRLSALEAEVERVKRAHGYLKSQFSEHIGVQPTPRRSPSSKGKGKK